jgi:hypothetical protein
LGLGALAASPCLALTIQSLPPSPDVAQHLRQAPSTASRMLPAPDEVRNSFIATQRPLVGQGFVSSSGGSTTSFSYGSFHGTVTATPGYGASWGDTTSRDNIAPMSLTPPRR